MKIRQALAASVFALAIMGASTANAHAVFNFEFHNITLPSNGCCGPFDVTGLMVGNLVGSDFQLTNITGVVTEGAGANEMTYAISGLIPGSTDPGGYFGFDNKVITTAGTGPYSLDNGGIAFYATNPSYYSETSPTPSLSAFNIYGNGGSSYTLSTTASYDVNSPFDGTLSITAVPEPATWAMMLFGFFGIGFMMRSAGRKSAAVAA